MSDAEGGPVTTGLPSVSDYQVRQCAYTEAKALLESGHYLGTAERVRVWAGLYLPGSPGGVTLDGLLGVAGFGQTSREGVAASLWDPALERVPGAYELLRFYIAEGDHPANLASWFMARAIRCVPPEIQMLVSYADPAQGHHGGLYQASGWLYTGRTRGHPYHYEDADGKRIAKNTPWYLAKRQRDRGLNVNERPVDGERRIAAERGWTRVFDQQKHRYVFPRTRFARKHLRLAVLPAPAPAPEKKWSEARDSDTPT